MKTLLFPLVLLVSLPAASANVPDKCRADRDAMEGAWSDRIIGGSRFMAIEPNLMAGIRSDGDRCQMLVSIWEAGTPWANYSVSRDRNHLHLQVIATEGGNVCPRGELMDVELVRFAPECSDHQPRSHSVICAGNATGAGVVRKGPEGITHQAGNEKVIPEFQVGDRLSLFDYIGSAGAIKADYAPDYHVNPEDRPWDDQDPRRCDLDVWYTLELRLLGVEDDRWTMLVGKGGSPEDPAQCKRGSRIILPLSAIHEHYVEGSLKRAQALSAPVPRAGKRGSARR